MESYMLRMLRGVHCCGYGSLTKLYMVSGYAMIQLRLRISFVYGWAEFKIVEQQSQLVWQLWLGSTITPECSKVASRYNSWLPLSMSTIVNSRNWHRLDDRNGSSWREEAISANSMQFRHTSQRKLIDNERIRMCPYDGMKRGLWGIQWRCFQL